MEIDEALSVFATTSVVTVRPGDVVLFRCQQKLNDAQRQRATEVLNEVFPGHECMILEDGQDIAVLRPEPGFFERLINRLR